MDPVNGNYVFGTPLFDRATVQLGNGKTLLVVAKRSSPGDKYIQAIEFNGKPYSKAWFRHEDVVNGAIIVFIIAFKKNHYFHFRAEAIDKGRENFYLSRRIIMGQFVPWQNAWRAPVSPAGMSI